MASFFKVSRKVVITTSVAGGIFMTGLGCFRVIDRIQEPDWESQPMKWSNKLKAGVKDFKLETALKNIKPIKQRLGLRGMKSWRYGLEKLFDYGPISKGNDVELLRDGDICFETIFESIDNAKERVWLEVYIIENDPVSNATLEKLTNAAKRGCDVILMYDHIGSMKVNHELVEKLKAAGGIVEEFNTIWPLSKKRGPFLFRNHRKVLITDDICYVGSRNFSHDYAGPRLGTNAYHDTHVKLSGPCVESLADSFLRSVEGSMEIGDRRSPGKWDHLKTAPKVNGEVIQIVESNARRESRNIEKAIRVTLKDSATKRCLLTTPYFFPTRSTSQAMIQALKNGVDMSILTTGVSELPLSKIGRPFLRAAHQHRYGVFLQNGAKIYELDGQTLHTKTMTVDGLMSVIGSYNLDRWSAKINLEVIISVLGEKTAKGLEQLFAEDLARPLTREVTLEEWNSRPLTEKVFAWACAKLLAFSTTGFLNEHWTTNTRLKRDKLQQRKHPYDTPEN